MVCKEDVLSWFQSLKGSKRIEAMCVIMNMCYPLELRFYGTCLEDLGRKDFYVFKDEELKANDLSEIIKIRNIHDPVVRSKLIVFLSLLNSSNTIVAQALFKVISEEIRMDILSSLGTFSDPKLIDQYLLVLTIAQHHPAFSFDQQTFLTQLTLTIEDYINQLSAASFCPESYLSSSLITEIPPPYPISDREVFTNPPPTFRYLPVVQPRQTECQQYPIHITSLKVRPSQKKSCIRIRVSWGSGKATDAFKSPHDLIVFHQKLVELFPNEAKSTKQDKCIPPLPHVLATWNKQSSLSDAVVSSITEYIQQLSTRLPGYVIESEFVRNFFMPSFPNRSGLTRNRSVDGHELPPRNSRLRSLTIYNSDLYQPENSPTHRLDNKKNPQSAVAKKFFENGSTAARPSPVNSPLDSPSSSPYTSPVNSETNSRAPSPWNVSSVDRATTNASIEPPVDKTQTSLMPTEDLQPIGLINDSCNTTAKNLDQKSPPNGILGFYLPKGNLFAKATPLVPSNSNDSSPVCSEYSSPPQSPSPGEACNQSSSLSSGNEENGDKRPLPKALSDLCKVEETSATLSELPFQPIEGENTSLKGSLNRTAVSVIPFAVPYSTIVTQMPPPQNMKPAYLPVPCRTNCAPQHLSPGTIVYDNQFSRLPLPSALTFLPGPPPRSHSATPDRVMPPTGLPLSAVSPFPVTSGSATVPSGSCSITTQRSSNVTSVTSSSGRHKPFRDADMIKQTSDTPYATGYILNTSPPLTAVSCSCYTTNSARPSPSLSPSVMSPGTTPSVPVSMSYLGMPYLFHHSLPFLQHQPPANGYVPQGQGFSYALPNGLTALPSELIYPGQGFTLQSPSSQGNPGQLQTPVSQCYVPFPHTTAVPMKLVTCFNCGKVGHRGSECKEQTMDELVKQGKFQLNYNPVPKMPDGHE